MKKRNLNKIKQMVSIGMSCIMAGSTCNLPMMLHAEEVQTENVHTTYMVTSFDELNEEIAYQALSIGAEESEINFPDTLKVKVIRQVEEEPSTEADESVGEGNGAEDSQEGEEWTIEHITWKLDAEKSSLPEFDSSEESAGAVYIYTPTIPETDENGNHYILSEEAILPEIYTCTKCGHSYTEELAKLPSQTNQADQTNQIEPVNNSNEKDFIGTVTSVFLNVTDLAAKNFRISFWLMIQMLLKAVMQLW